MAVEKYARRERDSGGGLREKAWGGRLTPQRPALWVAVMVWRMLVWAARSLLYGVVALTHSTAGRVVLFGVAALVLLDASFGNDAVAVPMIGALAWPMLVVFGAWAYGRRRTWEERVRNAVYHVIPGHSRAEPEVVWFGSPGLSARLDLGRWAGYWAFGFRLPAGTREADLGDLAEHLRERLPASTGSPWMVRWDLRRSTAQVTLVLDMPDSLTRAEMLERLEMQEGG